MRSAVEWIVSALSLGSMYALLALGLTLVYSVMNLINFAYGMLLVWTAYIAISLGDAHVTGVVVVLASIAFAAVMSVLLGWFGFVPFVNASPVTLLLTSFGAEQVLQYFAVLVFGESPHVMKVPGWLNHVFLIGSVQFPTTELVELGVGVVVVLTLFLVVNRSRLGAQIRAAAEKPEVARLMGIRPKAVMIGVFAGSGIIAGVVGLLWFAQLGAVSPQADLAPTLDAFVAIVLGGLGNPGGALAGGFALGAVQTLIQQNFPKSLSLYPETFLFTIVILLLVFRPRGLLGRSAAWET
jgi:branched-chain amino acid transport system permease protein